MKCEHIKLSENKEQTESGNLNFEDKRNAQNKSGRIGAEVRVENWKTENAGDKHLAACCNSLHLWLWIRVFRWSCNVAQRRKFFYE